jgi:phosphate transport system protein
MANSPTEHIYRQYEDDLAQLQDRLLVLGGLAEQRLQSALSALADRDPQACAELARADDPLNRLHIEIDDRCFKLLALRQPMASDLRTILAGTKVNTDLERVGDLAVNIAEASGRYLLHPPVPAEADLPGMGAVAGEMLRDALDAFVKRDGDLARTVLDRDDTLDSMKTEIFRRLLATMLASPVTVEPALELVLISRHLERIGDHATNIAEDVVFIVSAKDVRHHGG